jgi:ABC-2 type transport system permease protein
MTKKQSQRASFDLRQISIVTRYELLKHLRRRRLLAVLIIAALAGVLLIVFPYALNVSLPNQAKEWAVTFFSFATTLIVVVGAFFAGDAIVSEFEHKTGYVLFPNPVRRTSLVLGKYMAAFISGLLPVVFYYALGVGGLLGIYYTVPLEIGASFLYALLYLCCVLGVTFLFSALFKSSMTATLLSFLTFILILQIVSQVVALAGIEPWYLPNYAAGSITQAINPLPDRVTQPIPGNPLKIYEFYPKFPVSIIVQAVYTIVAVALSIIATDRKEMA